jgi:CheY-like chemotaxis protein
MNTILRELGHQVDFVATGEAAVTASRGSYDVVLMDVTLSGLNRIEATRRIRALQGGRMQSSVFGHSERGDEQAANAAGMNFIS